MIRYGRELTALNKVFEHDIVGGICHCLTNIHPHAARAAALLLIVAL